MKKVTHDQYKSMLQMLIDQGLSRAQDMGVLLQKPEIDRWKRAKKIMASHTSFPKVIAMVESGQAVPKIVDEHKGMAHMNKGDLVGDLVNEAIGVAIHLLSAGKKIFKTVWNHLKDKKGMSPVKLPSTQARKYVTVINVNLWLTLWW